MGPDEFPATIEMSGTFELPDMGTIAEADLHAEMVRPSIITREDPIVTNENFLRFNGSEPILSAVDIASYGRVSIDNRIEDISIRLGKLDTANPDTFYEFLRMWPLYNENGQVVALFDTKEHRDEAKEKILQMKINNPASGSVLSTVFKNRSHKMPADDVS